MTALNNPEKLNPWTLADAQALAAKFGLKTIGGWRATDQYPDHPGRDADPRWPGGRALDLMINDIPNGKAVGDAIAAELIANPGLYNVDYVIWYGRSWNPTRGTWAPYTGSNKHTDHVHLSTRTTPPAAGVQKLVAGAQNLGSSVVGSLFNLDRLMNKIEGTSITLAAAGFGAALLGIGVVLAVKPRKKG